MLHLVDSIRQLTAVLTDPARTPAERLSVLREVAEFAQQFKLGGEDKIRVVGGVCEGVSPVASRLWMMRMDRLGRPADELDDGRVV